MSLNTNESSVPARLGGFGRLPLSMEELRRLYTVADWGVVLGNKRARYAYGARTGLHTPLAMFQALALPALVHIESEEALVRELKEREELRALVGFEGEVPSRAMFWHFRHTPPGFFPDTMLTVLVAIAIAARTLDLPLPCVRAVPAGVRDPVGAQFTLAVGWYGPEIDIWRSVPEGSPPNLDAGGRPVGELLKEVEASRVPKKRRGLYAELGLPATVAVARPSCDAARFVIDEPDWLKSASGVRTHSKDTVTTLGPAQTGFYAACNLIVLRQESGAQQVLLSRRLNGPWKGQHVLPGGKQKPGETLEECACRELHEETGLRFQQSKPVSLNLVHMSWRAPAFSVGVLVTEFIGEVQDREPQLNEKWQWFDVTDLPGELALPAELALKAYRKARFQDLQWSDIEVRWRRSGPRAVQLTLDSLFGPGSAGMG